MLRQKIDNPDTILRGRCTDKNSQKIPKFPTILRVNGKYRNCALLIDGAHIIGDIKRTL